ncbi:hypothetical protein [Sphingobacterium siyangense]
MEEIVPYPIPSGTATSSTESSLMSCIVFLLKSDLPYFFDLKCIAKVVGVVSLFEEMKVYVGGSGKIPKSQDF